MTGKVVSHVLAEPGRGLRHTLQTGETFASATSHQPSTRGKPFFTPGLAIKWTLTTACHRMSREMDGTVPLGLLPPISH